MKKYFFIGVAVFFTSLFSVCEVAAAPLISSTSGTWNHKSSITVSGSGFGTKATAAPVVWDDGEHGQSLSVSWTGYAPTSGSPSSINIKYDTNNYGLAPAHSNGTHYITGKHDQNGNAYSGDAVELWKDYSFIEGSIYYISYYMAMSSEFDEQSSYSNYKFFVNNGAFGGPYELPNNWYGSNAYPPSLGTYRLHDDAGGLALNPPFNNYDGPILEWQKRMTWIKAEWEIKTSKVGNGFIRYKQDGLLKMNYTGNTDGWPGTGRSFGIGGYADSINDPRRFWDDIYLDNSDSHVVLANNSNIGNASIIEVQIPSAWSSNSIAITSNLGKFTSGQTAYLFVYDSTGTFNATGYPVVIGGTSTPDTQSPTSPTNLSATATSQSSITVSWNPATDNIGVTGYQVERCTGLSCTTFANVGNPTASPFVDSGLTASTGYSYHVRALDAAGNMSGWSNVVGATTQAPDTTPPSTPTSLSATATSSSTIDLTWTASTDNVGVTGYKVERCSGASCTTFTQVGTPTTNSYSDTGLSASTTYRYQVRAVDGAGYNSSYSSIASVTTQAASSTESIWTSSTVPGTLNGTDGIALTLGTKFKASVDGLIRGIRFYKGTSNTGTHTGRLWTLGGTQLGSVAFTNETASGWQEATFTSPISITANTVYVVSYYSPTGYFSMDGGYFSGSGHTNGNLYALRDGESGGNGVYDESGSGHVFPTSTSGSNGYYVDVVFSPYATLASCNTVTTTNFSQSAYNSYGAPFDAFQTSTNLLDAKCNSADTHTVNLTTGVTGDTTRIVYTKGYYYDPVTAGWTQYSGTCTGALNGEWCQGSISATITNPNISTASAANPTYVVGMTCSVQNGSWRCGCRDTTCANFYWQVQGAGQ